MAKSLRAVIRYREGEYGAFEVMSVLGHLRRSFPGIIICADDLAWRDFDWFQELFDKTAGSEYGGAMQVALRDGIRREPRFRFRFVAGSGETVFGWVGRDSVGFECSEEFPPKLERSIKLFLESLTLGEPEIQSG